MTVTVLVPNDGARQALDGMAGVEAIRYDVGGVLPPGADRAQVLVPDFLAPAGARALFDRLPALRLVQLLTAGAQPWIDLAPPGVMVSTCRGAHGGSTAEWVMAVLLAGYRDLLAFERARVAGEWAYHLTDTLQDKRVLVVGAGDLGTQLRRRLEAFDAHATLVGRTARPGVHGMAELPELLGAHDAVVLMVPLTEETTGMVDATFLARMRDGAVLVNAARGPVVDTDALVAELTAGRLRAALDVTDPEPLPPGHPLWTVDGLLLTPHVAGSCRGHRDRAYAVMRDEVERFVSGREPANLIRGAY